jgi:hypothetical protein
MELKHMIKRERIMGNKTLEKLQFYTFNIKIQFMQRLLTAPP